MKLYIAYVQATHSKAQILLFSLLFLYMFTSWRWQPLARVTGVVKALPLLYTMLMFKNVISQCGTEKSDMKILSYVPLHPANSQCILHP